MKRRTINKKHRSEFQRLRQAYMRIPKTQREKMTDEEVALLFDYYALYSLLQNAGYPTSMILSECWKEERLQQPS